MPRAADPRARHRQARGGARSTVSSACSTPSAADAIVAAARGGDRRQARRSFSAGGLADRLRHADQHERQRGDRQPRQRDARRQARREDAGASQRSRQHEPVVERHASRPRCTSRRRDEIARPARSRRSTHLQRRARSEGRRSSPTSSRSAARILQDATPLTLGQEFSGYAAQVEAAASRAMRLALHAALSRWRRAAPRSAPGSTRSRDSARPFAERSRASSPACRSSPRRTSSRRWPSHDAYVFAHGALNALADRAVQDRQRHPPARLGPALRPRRADPAGERARLLDHARQGQSDPVPRR